MQLKMVAQGVGLVLFSTPASEMMVFLHKSKFPMINIAIIITIANQNCFLLWSDVFIFGTIHYLGQGISLLMVAQGMGLVLFSTPASVVR
jgi:hypothetical protein